MLKEYLSNANLKTSGSKLELLERAKASAANSSINNGSATLNPCPSYVAEGVDPLISRHLIELVSDYVQASGGEAGSRWLGRYLGAAQSLDGKGSASMQLKKNYGSLAGFLSKHRQIFERDTSPEDEEMGFYVRLRGQPSNRNSSIELFVDKAVDQQNGN